MCGTPAIVERSVVGVRGATGVISVRFVGAGLGLGVPIDPILVAGR